MVFGIIIIMNKYVKRGYDAYKIFLKNKVASSFMMFFSGVMMFIAALNGKGNDTKSLPIVITVFGAVLTVWGVYKFGYLKCRCDEIGADNINEKNNVRKLLLYQAIETLLYAGVLTVGILLLVNEAFTNKALNIMAGFFTTLNGVFGVINVYKKRDNVDFQWKLMMVLTVIELIAGPYFIFGSDSIGIPGYIIMGALTTVAGIIEMISAFTRDNMRKTLDDAKQMIHIIKDDDESSSN